MPQDPKWFVTPDEMRKRAAMQKAAREAVRRERRQRIAVALFVIAITAVLAVLFILWSRGVL